MSKELQIPRSIAAFIEVTNAHNTDEFLATLTDTDFSRVVFQFQHKRAGGDLLDTTDFSRVVFQFRPSSTVQS